MRRLTYMIGVICLLIVAYTGLQCVFVLHLLERDYPYPKTGAVKYIRSNAPAKTLVIGCSNVQHNIDIPMVQDSIPVDFLYFSASETSTFLQYLVDKEMTAGYTNVVLYAPYHILQKSNRFGTLDYRCAQFGSYDYSVNIIEHHPEMIFYPWPSYYNTISKFRAPERNQQFIINHDSKVDSLIGPSTSYRKCDLPYVSKRHVFKVPEYSEEDETFIKSLATPGQHLYLIFPSLPNVEEFRSSSLEEVPMRFCSVHQLNKPQLLDSSLFFDQWYHLDYCGRKVETAMFLHAMSILAETAQL